MEETMYCLCCDEDVPFNRIERVGRVDLNCVHCGFPVAVEEKKKKSPAPAPGPPKEPVETSPDASPRPAPGRTAPAAARPAERLRHVLVADDSKFTRRIIQELLLEKGFAELVDDFENGLGLTSAFAKIIADGRRVDAVVVDINMPEMDGITAARLIRGIESQNDLKKSPIIFFSAVKADENLRRQMQRLAPAWYVNKGSDPDPDRLAERVEGLLGQVLT